MTDLTTETPTKTKKTPRPEHTISSTKKTTLSIWLLTACAILMALTALYMNRQLAQTIQQQSQTFNATLNMLTQQQSSTEARLQAHRAITQSQEVRDKQARTELEKNIHATLAQYHHVADDWRLLKARHLLELAGLNAHWSTDKDATIAMLNEADAILAPLHNPALLTVRKALAHDVHAIKSAPTTDITALLTQLDTAKTSTWSLSVTPLPREEPSEVTSSNHQTQPGLSFLKNLVHIRYNPNHLEPKPTLAFESILRATVHLNLEEAQWAVLERNNAVYQLTLNQAITTLQQSFMTDKARTKALVHLLNQLKTIQLHPEPTLPEQALTALNQVILTTDSKNSEDAS